MSGYDKDKIKAVVHSMSIGSKFQDNEERKLKAVQRTIAEFIIRKNRFEKEIAAEHRNRLKSEGQRLVLELQKSIPDTDTPGVSSEGGLNLWKGPCYCHLDLHMFFCAVEFLHNPLLRGKPVAVGGMGMIGTANYEARKFGIRAGMPGFIALKLCSDLVLTP